LFLLSAAGSARLAPISAPGETRRPANLLFMPDGTLGHDGNIRVTHSRSALDQPQGVRLTIDVFDPQGHFVKQVVYLKVAGI
jgi:hypothetical protein